MPSALEHPPPSPDSGHKYATIQRAVPSLNILAVPSFTGATQQHPPGSPQRSPTIATCIVPAQEVLTHYPASNSSLVSTSQHPGPSSYAAHGYQSPTRAVYDGIEVQLADITSTRPASSSTPSVQPPFPSPPSARRSRSARSSAATSHRRPMSSTSSSSASRASTSRSLPSPAVAGGQAGTHQHLTTAQGSTEAAAGSDRGRPDSSAQAGSGPQPANPDGPLAGDDRDHASPALYLPPDLTPRTEVASTQGDGATSCPTADVPLNSTGAETTGAVSLVRTLSTSPPASPPRKDSGNASSPAHTSPSPPTTARSTGHSTAPGAAQPQAPGTQGTVPPSKPVSPRPAWRAGSPRSLPAGSSRAASAGAHPTSPGRGGGTTSATGRPTTGSVREGEGGAPLTPFVSPEVLLGLTPGEAGVTPWRTAPSPEVQDELQEFLQQQGVPTTTSSHHPSTSSQEADPASSHQVELHRQQQPSGQQQQQQQQSQQPARSATPSNRDSQQPHRQQVSPRPPSASVLLAQEVARAAARSLPPPSPAAANLHQPRSTQEVQAIRASSALRGGQATSPPSASPSRTRRRPVLPGALHAAVHIPLSVQGTAAHPVPPMPVPEAHGEAVHLPSPSHTSHTDGYTSTGAYGTSSSEGTGSSPPHSPSHTSSSTRPHSSPALLSKISGKSRGSATSAPKPMQSASSQDQSHNHKKGMIPAPAQQHSQHASLDTPPHPHPVSPGAHSVTHSRPITPSYGHTSHRGRASPHSHGAGKPAGASPHSFTHMPTPEALLKARLAALSPEPEVTGVVLTEPAPPIKRPDGYMEVLMAGFKAGASPEHLVVPEPPRSPRSQATRSQSPPGHAPHPHPNARPHTAPLPIVTSPFHFTVSELLGEPEPDPQAEIEAAAERALEKLLEGQDQEEAQAGQGHTGVTGKSDHTGVGHTSGHTSDHTSSGDVSGVPTTQHVQHVQPQASMIHPQAAHSSTSNTLQGDSPAVALLTDKGVQRFSGLPRALYAAGNGRLTDRLELCANAVPGEGGYGYLAKEYFRPLMSATQAKHLCRAWAGSGGAASGDVGAKRLHRLGPHVPVVRLPRSLIAQDVFYSRVIGERVSDAVQGAQAKLRRIPLQGKRYASGTQSARPRLQIPDKLPGYGPPPPPSAPHLSIRTDVGPDHAHNIVRRIVVSGVPCAVATLQDIPPSSSRASTPSVIAAFTAGGSRASTPGVGVGPGGTTSSTQAYSLGSGGRVSFSLGAAVMPLAQLQGNGAPGASAGFELIPSLL